MPSREGQCWLGFGHANATTWIANATAGSPMQAPRRSTRSKSRVSWVSAERRRVVR